MKIKVSEASGPALNWLVGIAQGWTVYPNDSIEHGDTFHLDPARTPFGPTLAVSSFNPSTNWSQGGPIIEREKLAVWPDDEGGFFASAKEGAGRDYHGPTPLVAAMRCYVASKLGEEVEVPDELA